MLSVQNQASNGSGSVPCLDRGLAPEAAHLATCTLALQAEFNGLFIGDEDTNFKATNLDTIVKLESDSSLQALEYLEATKEQMGEATFEPVNDVASNAHENHPRVFLSQFVPPKLLYRIINGPQLPLVVNLKLVTRTDFVKVYSNMPWGQRRVCWICRGR